MDRLSVHLKCFWSNCGLILLIGSIIAIYFGNTHAVSEGVRNGLLVCGGTLIPSLFPFMILCSFLVSSRLSDRLSVPFTWITTRVLRLPSYMGAVFVMSLIGGYPAGAKMIADMYRAGRIDSRVASRMLCYCVNAGPAFLITAVGSRMFGNSAAGVLLFCSQTVASVILAILSRFWADKLLPVEPTQTKLNPLVPSFVSSVKTAAEAMFSVCAFVTAFSAIVSFVQSLHIATVLEGLFAFAPKGFADAVINGLFEVTLGCAESPAIGGTLSLYIACAICSFGGLSVMGQALSFFSGIPIKTIPYLLSRPIHMVLSCGILFGLTKLFPRSIIAFMPANSLISASPFSATPTASLSLMALCAALILSKKDSNPVLEL